MNTPEKKNNAKSTVAKSASEPKLNKHDEAAIEAAKTNTKNNGSHIVKQRQKLVDDAKATKETK